MPRKDPEAKGKLIPNDWDGVSYTTFMLCCPDSLLWRSYVRGAIYDLTRGRKWDANTGSILNTQAIAWEVYDSMSNCNDLADKMDSLITAVNGIAINLIASASASGGCCDQVTGGTVLPVESGNEGGVPPKGFETLPNAPGSAPYQDRKCKIANLIHEQTRDLVSEINQSGIVNWVDDVLAESTSTTFMSSFINYLILKLSSVFPVLAGFWGTVIAAVATLVLKLFGEIDLDELEQALNDFDNELVCALYNGISAADATNDYLQVLADNGVSVANREVILAVFIPRLVNTIFFKSSEVEGLEEALQDYVAPIPCSCGCNEFTYDFNSGLQNWVGDLSHDTSNGVGGSGCLSGTVNTPNTNPATTQYLRNEITLAQVLNDIGIPESFVDFDGTVEIILHYKPEVAQEVGGGAYVLYDGQPDTFVDLWDGQGAGNGVYHGPRTTNARVLKKNGANCVGFAVGIGTGGTNNQDRDGFIDNVTIKINC